MSKIITEADYKKSILFRLLAKFEISAPYTGILPWYLDGRSYEDVCELYRIWDELTTRIYIEMVSESENIYKNVCSVTLDGYVYDLTLPEEQESFFAELRSRPP
jgi:hypothetical protein